MSKNLQERFRIIPVIDILNGVAVHAIKGKRNTYEPVKTKLVTSSSPIDLIKAYDVKFSFSEVYIADLDSIINENPNIDLLNRLLKTTQMKIMLDAGVRNLYDILQIKKIGLNKIIIASETIDSLNVVDDAIKEFGGVNQIIISIDMKNKNLLARSPDIKRHSVFSLIEAVYQKGIKEIILLDLARIGAKCGCYDDSYGKIRNKYPDIQILVGGGVKDMQDLKLLRENGINGALLATVLHEGIIYVDDIKNFYD